MNPTRPPLPPVSSLPRAFAPPSALHQQYPNLCREFIRTGACARGEHCLYSHNLPPELSQQTQPITQTIPQQQHIPITQPLMPNGGWPLQTTLQQQQPFVHQLQQTQFPPQWPSYPQFPLGMMPFPMPWGFPLQPQPQQPQPQFQFQPQQMQPPQIHQQENPPPLPPPVPTPTEPIAENSDNNAQVQEQQANEDDGVCKTWRRTGMCKDPDCKLEHPPIVKLQMPPSPLQQLQQQKPQQQAQVQSQVAENVQQPEAAQGGILQQKRKVTSSSSPPPTPTQSQPQPPQQQASETPKQVKQAARFGSGGRGKRGGKSSPS